MVRCAGLMVALLTLLLATDTRGQASDDVRALRQENERLKLLLEAANQKIKELQKEIDRLKGDGKETPKKKTRTLADILTVGTTIRGDYRFRGPNKSTGEWTLIVKELNGKKFKGIYTATQTTPNKGKGTEVEVEGEIDGDRLTFSTVNTTKIQATATGGLTSRGVELTWDGRAGIADLKASVDR